MLWRRTINTTGHLSPGDKFEKFTVEKLLGCGGMGAVYLVRHDVLDSCFALKVLFPEAAQKNRSFVDRFIREAKLACKIKHPNLISVHDAGKNEATDLYYIIMDYVSGGTLRDILKQQSRIPPKRALGLIAQIASAMDKAHQHNMVHRDIKPENIMMTADGCAKLADLGIAKSTNEQDTTLTLNTAVFGTPAYMAPEQAVNSRNVDCRADIYSLGIVLFEMIAGQQPYSGSNPFEIISQVLKDEEIPDVRLVNADIPKDVAELIKDMTAKKVEERISSPAELINRIHVINLPEDTEICVVREESDFKKILNQFPDTEYTDQPVNFISDTQDGNGTGKKQNYVLYILIICIIAIAVMAIPLLLVKNKPQELPIREKTPPVESASTNAVESSVSTNDVVEPMPTNVVKSVFTNTVVIQVTNEVPIEVEEETNDALEPDSIVVLGDTRESIESFRKSVTSFLPDTPVSFQEAESISGYRDQMKEIIRSKPKCVILIPSAQYAEYNISQSNFETMIRAKGAMLRDAMIPFAFVLDADDSVKTRQPNSAVKEYCNLRSIPYFNNINEAEVGLKKLFQSK